MDGKRLGLGLGIFSVALGAVELLASRRLASTLDVEGHEGVIKAFGAREVLAGVNLLAAPAHSTNMWNRVAGDAMDLTALALASRGNDKRGALAGAFAFVGAATVLDIVVARLLDRQTGKVLPVVA